MKRIIYLKYVLLISITFTSCDLLTDMRQKMFPQSNETFSNIRQKFSPHSGGIFSKYMIDESEGQTSIEKTAIIQHNNLINCAGNLYAMGSENITPEKLLEFKLKMITFISYLEEYGPYMREELAAKMSSELRELYNTEVMPYTF